MDNQINPDIIFSDIVESDGEFIPLFSPEDEKRMNEEQMPDELPIMPLRNAVLFPGVVIPITVGRSKTIRLIKEAYKNHIDHSIYVCFTGMRKERHTKKLSYLIPHFYE